MSARESAWCFPIRRQREESACGARHLARPLSRFPLRGQAGGTAASSALRLGQSTGPKQNAHPRSGPVRWSDWTGLRPGPVGLLYAAKRALHFPIRPDTLKLPTLCDSHIPTRVTNALYSLQDSESTFTKCYLCPRIELSPMSPAGHIRLGPAMGRWGGQSCPMSLSFSESGSL